jgi:asparagine synthase (glutamine-hydrolysing)
MQMFAGSAEPDINGLRGAFAAVATDGERVWCWRDHLGLEPLYFGRSGANLVVGSEPKQLLAGLRRRREPDLDVVESIVFGGPLAEGACALRGVERLPKGCLLRFDGERGLRIERYWYPEHLLETADLAEDEIGQRFDTLMRQAARRVLRSNTVLMLSGGIDSPGIAAFLAPENRRSSDTSLPVLSMVYPDHPAADEREYVELLAKRMDLELHTHVPGPPLLGDLGRWSTELDGPWHTWSAQRALDDHELVKRLGWTTVVTGDMAEFSTDQGGHTLHHLLYQRRFATAWEYIAGMRNLGLSRKVVARTLLSVLSPLQLRRMYRRRLPLHGLPQWLGADAVKETQAAMMVPGPERWRRDQLGFLDGPGVALEASAMLQHRSGVNYRTPWADVDLWEFFMSLPAGVHYPHPQHKALVRRLLRGHVPDRILDRKDKTVLNDFVLDTIDYAGFERWLRRPRHRIGGIDYGALWDDIEGRRLDVTGYMWAKDIAVAHAFLDSW